MYVYQPKIIPLIIIGGGSRGSYSGGGYYGGGGGGGGGFSDGTIVLILLASLGGAGCIMACLYCCSEGCEDGDDDGWTKCYLCLDKIGQSKWDDGSHRKDCIRRNLSYVNNLKVPFPLKCPMCSKLLRQWPNRGPEVFFLFECVRI